MTPTEPTDAGAAPARVWDPGVRLLHWALAISVVGAWIYGEWMDFDTIERHMLFGYAAGGVVAARLLWSFFGAKTARLSELAPRPKRIAAYARTLLLREPSRTIGHNPLGALSALALLLLVAAQAFTGLFTFSDVFFAGGPLAEAVSPDVAETMNRLHHRLPALLVPLVALHLAAIAFYWIWKRENLVRPMITGRKPPPAGAPRPPRRS